MQEKRYGLIIRAPKSQQKAQLTRPAIPKPIGFLDDDDDDDDDVERDISRQANKNKSLKDVEEQHKKALEEDPSVFDYDGVYDEMKSQIVKPKVQERQQRESKYIALLKDKAKRREREQEVVYERKLAKERSQEDHLYADKDKFLTSAYKRKLAEKEQWEREEHLRQLREERDDVTKKSDITDFYFNLSKNVAFGAGDEPEPKKPKRHEPERPESQKKEPVSPREDVSKSGTSADKPVSSALHKDHPSTSLSVSPSRSEDRHQKHVSGAPQRSPDEAHHPDTGPTGEQPPNDQPKQDHHKKNEDALAAAKERFLARKKAKVVEY